MSRRKLTKNTIYTELHGRVYIKPQNLVGDIDFKISDATKITYENKPYVSPSTGKHSDGYNNNEEWSQDAMFVLTVIKIIDRKAAPLIRDELGSNCGVAVFDVTFQAKVLKLSKGDIINAKVITIHRSVSNDVNIFAQNNHTIIFMNRNLIDMSNFVFNESGQITHKATGKPLEVGDYISVRVIKTDMQLNDSNLKVIGYLLALI